MTDETPILCCAPVDGELLLPDNLTGPCDVCGVTVQFRPHAPRPHILRCMRCVAELLEEGDTVGTTPQMIEDARRAYFRRQQ